jgi:hypothetical protein
MGLNKSTSLKRLIGSKKLKLAKRSTRFTAIGASAIALIVFGVTAAALLTPWHQSPQPVPMSTLEARPDPSVAHAVATTTSSFKPISSEVPKAESVEQGPDRKLAIVTITGCLERDHETFRLKNTSGANAPTSRTWKSGFLKKGPATIEVVDSANRLRLSNQVGRRVNVTGVLVDREMQLRSLRRLAGFCIKNPKA